MQEFDAEEKFNEDLNEIKDKINECKLSEEFKSNLQEKLEIEYNKDTAKKEKNKKIIFPTISKKLATVAACFVLLFSGCVTFADEIECWVEKIFSNTDRIVERAIANGNYREIDMEYVEDNGVSIKVDYLVVEEDSMYIAFNVLTEEEFERIYFDDINIWNITNNLLLSGDETKYQYMCFDKKISSNNVNLIYKINGDFKYEKDGIEFQIIIPSLTNINNEEYNTIYGNWKLNITQ